MANITTTTAAAFIPEIWSLETLDFRQKNLVLAALADRAFQKDAKIGDTVHVAGITEMSVAAKSASTQLTFTANTESTTDILINKHYYMAFLIEDIVKIQANLDLKAKYTGQGGYVLAKRVDTDLAALVATFTNPVGTLNVGLIDEDIRRAQQYLDDADVPQEDRFMVFSGAERNNLLGIDKYVNRDFAVASYDGKGFFGGIYGVPAMWTSNLTSNSSGHDNVMGHKSAIALVIQQDVTSVAEYSVRDLGFLVASYNVYGAKLMRPDHGVWMKGK